MDNLSDESTILKLQNKWVAFDNENNIIASAKSYIKLNNLIPEKLKGKVQTTFINSTSAYIAP